MTQSLLNNGKDKDYHNEHLRAEPKWICAEEYKPRPLNKSGAQRVELVRNKENKVQFLAVYNDEDKTFTDPSNCNTKYSLSSLEVKIVEIE